MLVASILTVVHPLILAVAIDEYIIPGNIAGLGTIALIYFAVAVVAFLLNVVSMYITTITGLTIITRIRQQAFYQLQEFSMDYYDREATGRIVSRVTNDVERLMNLLSTGIIEALVSGMFLSVLFFVLFSLDFRLAVTVLIIFPILSVFIVYFRIKTRIAWQKTRRTLAKVTGYYQEAISGIEVSKAFAAETFMEEEFNTLNLENYETRLRALLLFAIFFPLVDTVLAIGTGLVVLVGGVAIGTSTMSVGLFVAFLSYLGRIAQPVMTLSTFYNNLVAAMAALERIFDILDRNPGVIPREKRPLNSLEGGIEFRDVSFAYDQGSPMVLSNFNLEIPAKGTYALVGHTGAGKTTVTNLLCRFYDFDTGQILLDGKVDIRDLDLHSYRNWVAIIPQDSFLFTGTIRENLLYGKPDATEEEIEQALLKVGAFDFVMNKGLDTEVGERGARLSMGERQLVCFARAVISDPKILILDEATSSIDPHTELVIQQSLHQIIRNRTTVIIAHRLSTLKNAEKIIVMEDGQIRERGTFQELIDKQGIFADLYSKQFADQET